MKEQDPKTDANKPKPSPMSRKEFIRGALWAAGAVLVLPGCGSDDDGGGSGGSGNGGSGNGGSGGTSGGSSGSGNGGSGGSSGGTGGSSTAGTGGGGGAGCDATITSNHGHVLMVTPADVDAAQDKTYDIQGGAGHSHSVTVTAADFATLAGGSSVTLTSTEAAAHMHTITVTCSA